VASSKLAFDPAQLLDTVPVPNEAVRRVPKERGLLLWVPIQKRWWMGPPLGWVLPFRSEKGIALDALGAEVYGACDGTTTTERIIEAFAKRHKIRFHEARLSVLAFLKSLVTRNLVVLVSADAKVTPSALNANGPTPREDTAS
jgi:hypothetical protein